jgi:very-short-patch-repair endonuclease
MTTLLKNARRLRAEMTDAERCLWQALRLRQVGARFRRQAPVGPYIADFICFNPRMVIEVDGGQHAEETTKDEDRDAWFAKGGFVVLRFWNNEVLGNIDGVMEQITDALARSAPPPQPSPARGEGA